MRRWSWSFSPQGINLYLLYPGVRVVISLLPQVQSTELSCLYYSMVLTSYLFYTIYIHGSVYMSDSVSLFIPPYFPPNPVSTDLFSVSVSLFLP